MSSGNSHDAHIAATSAWHLLGWLRLRDENRRLRAALQRIAEYQHVYGAADFEEAQEIAREALS